MSFVPIDIVLCKTLTINRVCKACVIINSYGALFAPWLSGEKNSQKFSFLFGSLENGGRKLLFENTNFRVARTESCRYPA